VPLPVLADDALHVVVFGPGVGELVAVRAPPGRWLIIDGCGPPTRSYGQRLLAHYRGKASLIAFTHPHLDHASGLLEVIDEATRGDSAQWPALGVLSPSPRAPSTLGQIAPQFGGAVEDTLSAIDDRWHRAPACRWDLRAGETRELGEAEVSVCSPSAAETRAAYAAWRRRQPWNPNRVATAFELSWRRHRILLGSDLEEADGGGWTEAAVRGHVRAPHLATKVPHHGSIGATHDVWIQPGGATPPLFVVTPFARENLPRFDDNEGIHEMLAYTDRVHLTGLPRRHDKQGARAPLLARRSELRTLGKIKVDPVTPGWPDCFVIISVKPSGTISLSHGPGSVVVRR
jgi:hypothetical protein